MKSEQKAITLKLRGRESFMVFPVIADIKYDGEFSEISYCPDKKEWTTRNKYGLVRTFKGTKNPDLNVSAVFWGELVCNGGAKNSLYELLKNKNDINKISIKIFDVLWVGKTYVGTQSLLARKQLIKTIVKDESIIAESMIIKSKQELEELKRKIFKEDKWEGIVIKDMFGIIPENFKGGVLPWCKIKDKDIIEARVETISKIQERMEVKYELAGNIGSCGVKLCSRDKTKLKEGDMVLIEHQGILNGGGLRHPVYVRFSKN